MNKFIHSILYNYIPSINRFFERNKKYNNLLIYYCSNFSLSGGLTDRLKGIMTTYQLSLATKREYKIIFNNLLNHYDNQSQKERFERYVNDIERKEEEYLTEAINKLIIAKAINIASGGIPEINRIIIEKLKQTRMGKKESGGN